MTVAGYRMDDIWWTSVHHITINCFIIVAMRKSILFLSVIVSLIVAMFLYLNKNGSSSEIVILQAEEQVFKKKPQDPGGINIPNSDSHIYDQLKKYSNKTDFADINILPEPENPIDINFAQRDKNVSAYSVDDIIDNLEYYEEKFLVESNSEIVEDIVLPSKIAKTEINTDNNVIKEESGLVNDITADNTTSLHFIRATENIHKIAMEVEASSFTNDGYYIQLAITHSEKDAKNVWYQIKRRNFAILTNATPLYKKINKKDSRYSFLVLAGPYSNHYKAKLTCDALKKNKQNCIIMK